MKQKRYILPVLVAPALMAFGTRGAEVSYHPEKGSTVSKTFEMQSEIALDEFTIAQNGQEMDPSMIGEMEVNVTTTVTIAVTDEYVAVERGARPTKLTRTYDTLSTKSTYAGSNPMVGDMSQEMDGASELEGLRVTFTWDDDAGEYIAEFAEDSDGDQALLEDLTEDLDLRDFLPSSEVSEGDTWEVDPAELREIFVPGGAVKIEMDVPDEMDMSGAQPSPSEFMGDFDGEVTAEFVGLREEGGVKVAVIAIEAEVSTAKDMTSFAEEMMGGMEGVDMTVESMDMEWEFEGKGELLWNVERGVVYSFDMSGEISQTIDTAVGISMQGMEMNVEQSMVFSGTQAVTLTTEGNS